MVNRLQPVPQTVSPLRTTTEHTLQLHIRLCAKVLVDQPICFMINLCLDKDPSYSHSSWGGCFVEITKPTERQISLLAAGGVKNW